MTFEELISALGERIGVDLAAADGSVVFGGRLGSYRYTDMQDTIIAALELAGKEIAR